MYVKLNQKGRLFLAWYSLSYWWPLLYCPVALLAVMRRFYFPNVTRSIARRVAKWECYVRPFPPTLANLCGNEVGIGLRFYPPPPPKKKTKQNKTKQNKNEKTKKPCIETIRLYIKRRFFKYAISTGIVWYNFKLAFLIHREIWRLNRETVRWRPKPWNCWSSNSQIHKFFMSLSLQRFLFPATRARNLMSIRSAVEWFKTMRI